MESLQRYPIGIQTFSELRDKHYLYIDKTSYVYRMAHSVAKYMFLSRPRRFGKSLLTSTLRAYFEGRKELFEGLSIEKLETEWTAYPVLHFDMSTAKHLDKDSLIGELELKLTRYEEIYGKGKDEVAVNQRLQGLMKSLLPDYLHGYAVVEGKNTVGNMYKAILGGDMDGALRLLQTFLLTVPYTEHTAYEGHYQQMLYIIFSLLGYYVDVEVRTPRGRVDMVMRTATTLYVVELKLDKDAEAAMDQIDLKQYPERFALCGLPMVKVGINFDSERRTLGNWKIEAFAIENC